MSNNMIDEVIETLGAMYPSWRTASKDPDVRYHWGRAMSRAGITGEQIKQGVMRAERDTSSFPPSVGQFIGWCNDKHQLTPMQAWQEASHSAAIGSWHDPAVYHAAQRTGTYAIRNDSSRDTMKLFFDHYADVVDEITRGAGLCLPAPKEPEKIEPQGKPLNPEEAKAAFAKLRKQLEGATIDANT